MLHSTLTPSDQGHQTEAHALLPLLKQLEEISDLPPPYQRTLAAAAELIRHRIGKTIVGHQSNEQAVLYLIKGVVSVRHQGKVAIALEAQTAPLPKPIYKPKDKVEITATSNLTLLRIPHDIYVKQVGLAKSGMLHTNSEVSYLDDWHQLDGLERALSFGVLAHLPVTNVHTIVSRMEEVDVAPGEVIFEQGAPADYFYIVKAGTAEVCRVEADNTSTRLTVKVPGDAFGEEALVMGGGRSATLRMLTVGRLLRVSSGDFATLIHQPLRSPVTLESAQGLIADGARWIDLREPESFAREFFPNAINIPLALLRNKRNALDANRHYVVVSNDMKLSELGCYLLAEHGLTVYFVDEPIRRFALLECTIDRAPNLASQLASDLTRVASAHVPQVAADARAPTAAPTVLLRQLIEVERRRFDGLLAQRTQEIKSAAERQINAKIAATDQMLRAQVLDKMAEMKRQQEALLEEARKLQIRARELDAARLAFDRERTAWHAGLGLTTTGDR